MEAINGLSNWVITETKPLHGQNFTILHLQEIPNTAKLNPYSYVCTYRYSICFGYSNYSGIFIHWMLVLMVYQAL